MVANGPIVFFTFGLFLGPITSEFGWDRATFSSSLLAGHTLAALAYPFMGRAIDRFGIRPVTLTFIPIFALATAAVALSPASPVVFIALAGFCGLVSVGQAPPAYAKAVSAWFDERRGLALGIAMAGIGLGATLVPQFARWMIQGYGWRAGYVALGALTFAVAFPAVALFIREPETGAHASDRAGPALGTPTRKVRASGAPLPGLTIANAIRSASFWLLAVAVFLVVTTINGMVGHLVPMLTDRGVDVRQATATLSAVGLSTIAGRVVSGYLLDRFFGPYVAAAIFLLPLVGIGLLTSGAAGMAPVFAAMALGFGLGAEVDVIGFLTGRYFGLRAYGEIYGYLFAIFTLGTGLGPVLMALAFDMTRSYDTTLIAFGAALVLASVLVSRLGAYRYPAEAVARHSARV
ncbi:MAG: MFS transporter [Acidobacteria bacterium]|nr:MFS transporter [Acidobacteriota bacterium]